MPDLVTEEIYSTQQINIPPTFPIILKQYAKAAIRTQPSDLLKWSAAYFRALAKGETPPTKDRLEYPPPASLSELSPGYLKVLIKQLGKGGMVTIDQLSEYWNGICLSEDTLKNMIIVGNFGHTFDWLNFVAVAAGFLCNSLTQTMILLCNLLTDEPEGGSALIPMQTFAKLYTFLAGLDCGGSQSENDEDEDRQYMVPKTGVLPILDDRNASVSQASSKSFEDFQDTETRPLEDSQSSVTLIDNASTTTLKLEAEEADSESGMKCFCDPNENKPSSLDNQGVLETKGDEQNPVFDVDGNLEKEKIKSASTEKISNSGFESSVSSISPRGDLSREENPERTLKSPKRKKMRTDSKASKFNIPGIGPMINSIQVQAVINYLNSVSVKQEGMIKPNNINHFLCPPLEKVPASQKTRV